MRQDAEKLTRQTRRRLAVCLTAPPLAFILLAEVPDPHPVLALASVLYALHLGALLRPVWTGHPYPVTPFVLLAPAFLWLACLWLLPYTGAFARTEVVPLAGMAVVPVALVVAESSLRVRSATVAVCLAVAAAVTPHAPMASALTVGGVFLAVVAAVRSAMRPVTVISRLEIAADVAAQQAVADERLRMSRDLHDTLGRHLAVIAIKSELIAHTGKLEEIEQLQVLARASQSELRAVVNAARTTSLDDELDGARSLLGACGIRCGVTWENRGPSMPPEVQESLGWAVREAATNIMRHAPEATACTITLTRSGAGEADECALRVVNDGVRDVPGPRPGSGTGMDGLAQRVAPLGGRLEHGPGPRGTYRLVVTVPLARGRAA
ncbi:histidine kinase [Streptomyces sp. NPDC052079]|uniref:sensor histidine kinase n=1 Tax=Streptomyces sp. NPDC052079 TaxID=3155526 RepID=UPI00341827B7